MLGKEIDINERKVKKVKNLTPSVASDAVVQDY